MRIELISTVTGETKTFHLLSWCGMRAKDVMDKIKEVCDEMDGEMEIFWGSCLSMESAPSMENLEKIVKDFFKTRERE